MTIIIGAILLIKLFMLQVANPIYKMRAENNVVKKRIEFRGRSRPIFHAPCMDGCTWTLQSSSS